MEIHDWKVTSYTPCTVKSVTAKGDVAHIVYTQVQEWTRVVEHADTKGRDTGLDRTGPDDWPTWGVEEVENRIVDIIERHNRASIDSVPKTDTEDEIPARPQTEDEWQVYIKQTITNRLSELNTPEPTEVDITAKVK